MNNKYDVLKELEERLNTKVLRLDLDGTFENSTERYIDLIHRFNKDKAFDYVIGLKDREDKIIEREFDD